MVLAGNKEGQVNVNLKEFVDSNWFHNRVYRFIVSANECLENKDVKNPEAEELSKDSSFLAHLSLPVRTYYKWALANFEEFMEDYKGFVLNQISQNPNYVPRFAAPVKAFHKIVIRLILPRWLDFKLGRPSTLWHIDNTNANEEYNLNAIRERYGIGKKHYTPEQEEAAIRERAARRAQKEPNSKTGSIHDHVGPGVRALSDEDLELF